MKRILITGSRDWSDSDLIYETIAKHAQREKWGRLIIVHGDCSLGADRIARDILDQEDIEQEKHPADWEQHGKKAGFIRNKEMVDSGIDLCLAFIKNKSKGASHTAKLCKEKGIPVELYEE